MKQAEIDPKLRDHVRNMVYVGALAHLLGVEVDVLRDGLMHHFKGKTKPVDMNMDIVNKTLDWAKANLVKKDPYRVVRMSATDGLIMVDGNTAGALGAIFGGETFAAWYPITPSTSLVDALNAYLPSLRPPQDGKADYAVMQAEDELAAIG